MNDPRQRPAPVRLRVVHLASGDLWGGAEAQIYALAKELNRSAEISLQVVLLNHGLLKERLQNSGVEVTVLDETELNALQILYSLRRLLARMHPNIVHTHRQKENVLGSLAALLLPNCKSLRTIHGAKEFTLMPWQVHKMVYRLLDWFCGRFFQDRIVAVSDELASLLAKRFQARKISTVQNGVDTNELIAQSRLSITLPGPKDAFNVAFVGRLVPVKRVDVFIETAKQLLSENTDRYRFYIFGDGPLREEVEQQIRRLQIDPYVYSMGFRKDLPAHLARMNVLVMTSDHEGLPMTLLEALSLGVPVIAHAVGGIPEALGEGAYGQLVTTSMPGEYAERIRALAESSHLARGKTKEGLEFVSEYYSACHSAVVYTSIYRRLVS